MFFFQVELPFPPWKWIIGQSLRIESPALLLVPSLLPGWLPVQHNQIIHAPVTMPSLAAAMSPSPG